MRKMKILLSFALIISILFSLASFSLAYGEQKRNIVYTAIGDSIAAGIGASDPLRNSYVALFKNFLDNKYKKVTMHNVASSGDTSLDLLKKLSYNDPSIPNSEAQAVQIAVSKADIITVCIGANNVLGPLEVFKATGNKDGFTAGAQQFASDWPLIMTAIRTLNPKAQILVMNVYNPFSANDVLNGVNLEALSDEVLPALNGIIAHPIAVKKFNYRVVDIYSAFKSYNGKHPLTGIHNTNPDPHPTDKGHKLIYKEHEKVYLKLLKSNLKSRERHE